jgi:UDP-N-acetylglucosamine acyltransferase
MHKALYREDLTLQAASERIAQLDKDCPDCAPDVAMMLSFLKLSSAQRGIVR